jgi:hypothetical protein
VFLRFSQRKTHSIFLYEVIVFKGGRGKLRKKRSNLCYVFKYVHIFKPCNGIYMTFRHFISLFLHTQTHTHTYTRTHKFLCLFLNTLLCKFFCVSQTTKCCIPWGLIRATPYLYILCRDIILMALKTVGIVVNTRSFVSQQSLF